ncbi:beta-defensin 119 isoform X1 [Sturnira hondurensis]|uniref:beta-defensin 119 isoform X1 n=1 Tax=Sturnira hondurensis TaxID=192404 RepID=UPI001879E939|nr:beta-defensin 119 isoform X1 [Sturnira hondurensis]
MKPLLLFLAVLLATEPVVSVSCWMNGQCRLVCKDDEEHVIRCPNRKRCCILSRYLTMEPVTIDGIHPWTTPLPTRKPKHKVRPGHRGGR